MDERTDFLTANAALHYVARSIMLIPLLSICCIWGVKYVMHRNLIFDLQLKPKFTLGAVFLQCLGH